MALPKCLVLNHFVYDRPPLYLHKLDLTRVIYTHNIYILDSFDEIRVSNRVCNQMVGDVFVDRNEAYKIIAFEMVRHGKISKFFKIEEYTDNYIDTLKERLKNIKEHLSVSADRVEELGGEPLANKFRDYVKTITLETLV